MEIAAISLGRTVEVVHPDLESALRRISATGFAARCSARPTCLANRSNRRWPWAKTKKIKTFKNTDHFGGEMKCFSDCILKGTDPEPDGEEGYADARVLEGVLTALKSGEAVQLASRAEPPMLKI
jgi:hypothetical protein